MAYSKVGISIPKVTGAINIVVSTIEKAVKNLFDASKATLNTRFTSSSTETKDGVYITDYIDAVAGDEIYVKPAYVTDASNIYDKVNCYNSTSDTKIGAKVLSSMGESTNNILFSIENGVGHFTVPAFDGTTRIKIALRHNTSYTAITESDLANVVITKNEPIS